MIVYRGDRVVDFVTRVPVPYLVEQHIRIVGLYLKYWNIPYVDECERAGICVVPIWETIPGAALQGALLGHTHGITCAKLLPQLKIPKQKAVIFAHDTGLYNSTVPYYFQAVQTEIHPNPLAGYWNEACANGVRALHIPYAFNWTPAAKSWVQDPSAEIVQFPSGPFPGHSTYHVDMGKVLRDVLIYHPSDPLPHPIPTPIPPMPGAPMSTVFNNAELIRIDDQNNLDTQPGYNPATSVPVVPGVGKWRLMEDGSVRHLKIVEYANMSITLEKALTSGDLLQFAKWVPVTVPPITMPPFPPIVFPSYTFVANGQALPNA